MRPPMSPTGSGQRDLWTLPANATEQDARPVQLTNDAAVDWDPVWSPDGRYLYFVSDRGGAMNLWRVRIEEDAGRALGAPEALTVPSQWAGWISVARGGSRIAYVSLERRSSLYRVGFDPERAAVTGSPATIIGLSRAIRDHDISPDGTWVVFSTIGTRENLILVRVDGSGYRQITDDDARNRGVRWSPDGRRLLFYSNRSGRYTIWSVRPDGSALERMAAPLDSMLWLPVWSPDGTRFLAGPSSRCGSRTAGACCTLLATASPCWIRAPASPGRCCPSRSTARAGRTSASRPTTA
jgi:Tol biopolymer transport system component